MDKHHVLRQWKEIKSILPSQHTQLSSPLFGILDPKCLFLVLPVNQTPAWPYKGVPYAGAEPHGNTTSWETFFLNIFFSCLYISFFFFSFYYGILDIQSHEQHVVATFPPF